MKALIIDMRMNSASTREIMEALAERFQFFPSRNAVLGFIFRLRERGHAFPMIGTSSAAPVTLETSADKRRARDRLRKARKRAEAAGEPLPAPPPPMPPMRPIAFPEPVKGSGPLSFDDPWPSRRCRYPIFSGKPASGQKIFCGAPTQKKDYCLEHYRRLYVPYQAPKRKR